jgi:hypothetical protein
LKAEQSDAGEAFGLDAILPSQFYDRGLSLTRDDGIRNLHGAILEDAVRTFQSLLPNKPLTTRRRAAVTEAEAWIFDTSDQSPLSYNNVCESLGINPDAFRQGLLEWRRRLDNEKLKALPRRGGVRVQGKIRSTRKRERHS